MEITLLIKSIMGLVVILGLLVFLLFLPSRKKKKISVASKKVSKTSESPQKNRIESGLNSLFAIIKDRKTTTLKLKEALDLVIKHHGVVHKKLGLRPHPDFDLYMDILFTICRHPNTSKDLIVKFDRELERLNPEYKKEINDAISKGLNSRGI
ncbi:MAG: hypothetical protein U9Q29_06835 [Campylobacterota bacterium]|nr:hypothetical protein [Campylobacterota bacterium]